MHILPIGFPKLPVVLSDLLVNLGALLRADTLARKLYKGKTVIRLTPYIATIYSFGGPSEETVLDQGIGLFLYFLHCPKFQPEGIRSIQVVPRQPLFPHKPKLGIQLQCANVGGFRLQGNLQ